MNFASKIPRKNLPPGWRENKTTNSSPRLVKKIEGEILRQDK